MTTLRGNANGTGATCGSGATEIEAAVIRDTTTPTLLTVKEVAAALVCSEQNVYALIKRGELPYVPTGTSKGYRIDRDDLTAFIRGRKVQHESREPKAPRPRLKHIKL
jgi:excisionase family DNA binding protein